MTSRPPLPGGPSAGEPPGAFVRTSALMSMSMSLGVLQRAYRAAADKAVASLGLSHAMAWPLLFIGRMGDGLRQGTLAEAMSIEGPSLVRSLDQLVEAGFVVRREDPVDRRAKTLHLTPAGQRACGEIEAVLHDLRASLYQGLPDADIAACLRVFDALTRRLGTSVPTVPSGTTSHAVPSGATPHTVPPGATPPTPPAAPRGGADPAGGS